MEGQLLTDSITFSGSRLGKRKWMGVYLRLLAIGYGLSALAHVGNLLGVGLLPWSEMPMSWKKGDVGYSVVDTAAAGGLWYRTNWGIGFFLTAAGTQLILYLGFPAVFAFTPEQHEALHSMVNIHLVTIAGLFVLWGFKQ